MNRIDNGRQMKKLTTKLIIIYTLTYHNEAKAINRIIFFHK